MTKQPTGPFPIGQASRLTGLSLAMIDYLCRTAVVVPSASRSSGRGRGRTRRFTFSDVIMMRLIAKLLAQGITVRRLRSDLRKATLRYAAEADVKPPYEYLCTDGERAYFKNKSAPLEDVGSGQYAFGFIVDVDRVHGEVIDLLQQKPAPAKWPRQRRAS
jgi:DNA-binding transcriptional MerR regulator